MKAPSLRKGIRVTGKGRQGSLYITMSTPTLEALDMLCTIHEMKRSTIVAALINDYVEAHNANKPRRRKLKL